MATTYITLTGDINDLTDGEFDTRRLKVTLIANTTKIVDNDTGITHLGTRAHTAANGKHETEADGTFSFSDVIAATDLVDNLQYYVRIDYPQHYPRGKKNPIETFGPYDLSAESGTVTLASLETVQALDPSYASQFMTQAQELLDAQIAISGIDDTDSAVAALIEDDMVGPLTTAALSASIAQGAATVVEPALPGLRLTNVTHTDVGQRRPIAVHPDGSVIGWHFGVGFVRSTDDTATWSIWGNAHADLISRGVRELRFMDNGEAVAVMIGSAGDGEQLWVSSGLEADHTTATWTGKMSVAAPTITFSYGGVSTNDGTGVVIAAEYGPQGGAGKVYRSGDYGANWSTIFNLHTTIPEGEGAAIGGPATQQHLHGACYDPWWDRIWVAVGDADGTSRCMILYSDDAGTTWEIYPGTDNTTGLGQMVVPIAAEKAVLFCSDFAPNGVWSIPRTGYRQGGDFKPVHIVDSGTGIRYLGRFSWRNLDAAAPVILTFTGANAASPGLIVTTYDGLTFSTVYHDTLALDGPANYVGAMATVGPTSSGKIVGYWNNDDRFANGSIVTGYLPTQTVDRTALGAVRSFIRSGTYYAPPCGATPLSYGQGVMRASPFYMPADTAIDRLGINVQTAGESGSKLRLIAWADDNGVPGDLLVDGGQVAGDSTGFKEVNVSVVIPAGVVWLACVAQSCPTTAPTVWGNTYDGLAPIGSTNAALISSNGLSSFESSTSVTGAAPASFGTPNGGSGGPRVVFRPA